MGVLPPITMSDKGPSTSLAHRLVLGTAQLATPYGIVSAAPSGSQPSERAAESILELAENLGLGAVDTAPAYVGAEWRIGLSPWTGPVWSKFDPGFPPGISVQRSLTALKRRRLDVAFVHDVGHFLSLSDDQVAAISRMRGNAVDKLGISVYEPWEVGRCFDRLDFDVVQFPINVLDTRFERLLHEKQLPSNVSYVGRSVFLQGILAQPEYALRRIGSELRDAVGKWCQRWANMDPVSVTENGPPRSGYSVFVAGGVRPRSRSLSR